MGKFKPYTDNQTVNARKLKAQLKSEQEQREYDAFHTTKTAMVYLLHVTPSDGQSYYKIGYTTQTPHIRFNGTDIPSYTCINQTVMEEREAYQLEQLLHNVFQSKQYAPPTKHTGHTECFLLENEDVNWIYSVFQKSQISC